MRKFLLTASLLTLTGFQVGCTADVPQNNMDIENASQRALPPPSGEEDMPVVLAAEVEEVQEDILAPAQLSTEERLTVVEEKVENMRQELNLLRPAIKELIAQSIENKPHKMEPNVAQSVFPVEQVGSQIKLTQPVPPVEKETDVQSNEVAILDIRVGEHTNKTRLVIDLSQNTPYAYNLDAVEDILSIEFPEANVLSTISQTLSNSPNIVSYQTQSLNGGALLLIQLKDAKRILKTEALPATQERKARLYFDIGA